MAIAPELKVQFPVHPEPEPEPVVSAVPVKLNGSLARNTARLELVELSKATAANRVAVVPRNNRIIFIDVRKIQLLGIGCPGMER
jgi:hypothetical protein